MEKLKDMDLENISSGENIISEIMESDTALPTMGCCFERAVSTIAEYYKDRILGDHINSEE